MTSLPIYQIDAFTDKLFGGNPAAVVPLGKMLPKALMQSIAAENNLSETAFVAPRPDGSFNLRWFTPAAEIEFCGHATVASAHTLIQELGHEAPITFHTQIGALTVADTGAGYTLRAPNYAMSPLAITPALQAAFGPKMSAAYIARNNIYLEMTDAASVHNFAPNMTLIGNLLTNFASNSQHSPQGQANMGASIMAIGDGKFASYDFVSRHFAPMHGVDEDPVTGSAHAALAPFYANKLGKPKLTACQCSARSGNLWLEVLDDAVLITGQAITYLRGEIWVGI